MNYIKELNAFYDWLELNDVTPSAINLWYALMHINNKSGWASSFTVAESVLCVKTGLSDRTLRKVRNELKQLGRIDFVSRKGKAPRYNVIPFEGSAKYAIPEGRSENISALSSGLGSVPSSVPSSEVSSALVKQNETKQNETKELQQQERSMADILRDSEFAKLTQFYGENIGMMNKAISDELDAMCNYLNAELVLLALKESVLANANNKIKYTHSILKNWKSQNFKTVADVEQHEKRKEKMGQQRSNVKRYGGTTREEIVPAWFIKQQQEQSSMPEEKESKTSEEVDAKRRELQARLENMRRKNA